MLDGLEGGRHRHWPILDSAPVGTMVTTAVRTTGTATATMSAATAQADPIEVWPNMVGDIRDRLAESRIGREHGDGSRRPRLG